MTWHGDFKDLRRKAAADNVFRCKAFNFAVAKNPKYDGYQCGFAWMVYKFLDKKTSGGCVKNDILLNRELAEEFHNQLLENLKNEKHAHL